MSARQELHWVGPDRNVPAVTTQPERVWCVGDAHDQRPSLPFVPEHGHNALIHDFGHDWSMRGPGGCLRYSPGGGHVGAWLLCEWDKPTQTPKPKNARARNLSFAPAAWQAMQTRAAERGFASVSAYLTHLVNEDTKPVATGRGVAKVKR